jgi:hypothetical protein
VWVVSEPRARRRPAEYDFELTGNPVGLIIEGERGWRGCTQLDVCVRGRVRGLRERGRYERTVRQLDRLQVDLAGARAPTPRIVNPTR